MMPRPSSRWGGQPGERVMWLTSKQTALLGAGEIWLPICKLKLTNCLPPPFSLLRFWVPILKGFWRMWFYLIFSTYFLLIGGVSLQCARCRHLSLSHDGSSWSIETVGSANDCVPHIIITIPRSCQPFSVSWSSLQEPQLVHWARWFILHVCLGMILSLAKESAVSHGRCFGAKAHTQSLVLEIRLAVTVKKAQSFLTMPNYICRGTPSDPWPSMGLTN